MKQEPKEKRILSFLKALPHLEFTETGLKNICKRFGISIEELRPLINQVKTKAAK